MAVGQSVSTERVDDEVELFDISTRSRRASNRSAPAQVNDSIIARKQKKTRRRNRNDSDEEDVNDAGSNSDNVG